MNNEEISPDLDKAQLLVPVFGLESLDNSTDDNSTDDNSIDDNSIYEAYYYYYDEYDDDNTTQPETKNTKNVVKRKIGRKRNADFAK